MVSTWRSLLGQPPSSGISPGSGWSAGNAALSLRDSGWGGGDGDQETRLFMANKCLTKVMKRVDSRRHAAEIGT